MGEFQPYIPFKNGQDARVSAARRYERYVNRHVWYEGWQGANELTARQSLQKYGVAARLITTKEWIYDCWVPDPEFDECCMHMLIDEGDLISRYMNYSDLPTLTKRAEAGVTEFSDMSMADKIKHLTDAVDILEFFEIEDGPDAIPIEDIKLVRRVPNDIFKVRTLDDIL